MLSDKEMNWLDSYHERVRETLSPLVDDKTRAWLEQATREV
jgi:Xaa-Pro aminopeptidase